MRGEKRGDFQDAGEANEKLRIADEVLFLKDRREEFFLDVDHDEGGALGLKRTKSDFGVVGVRRGDGADGGHEGSFKSVVRLFLLEIVARCREQKVPFDSAQGWLSPALRMTHL